MAPRREDTYSDEDPSEIAQRAQNRILELKSARDERIKALTAESETALQGLRTRVLAYQNERRMSNAKACAAPLMRLIESVERRVQIEAKMEELVLQMDSKLREMEEMMKAGYDGREREVKQAKKAREG